MKNSRKKGNTYEVKLMNEYKELWYTDCKTSRNESKSTDDMWIDLCFTGMFNIQAKAYASFWGNKILWEFKNMQKNTKGHRLESNFNLVHLKIDNKGELVAMPKEDWYEIVRMLKANDII